MVRTLTATASNHHSDPDTQAACKFAVKSGGHASISGAANIQAGVTVDLVGLRTIEVKGSTASVGVGNTWGDVYTRLDALGMSVAGSRVSGVGVGGLSIGGGISFHSTRYGWIADTIIDYEVVLANGSLVSAKTDPNLLWALRGGGNNFGIITRIDIEVFEQGLFWGGFTMHAPSAWADVANYFAKINTANKYDEYAALITTWAYATSMGAFILNQMEYTKSPPIENPPFFAPLLRQPSLAKFLVITNMSQCSTALGDQQVYGERFVIPSGNSISTAHS